MPQRITIGQAAQAAGVSAKMIRHYERLGLLPAVARTAAGYRLYTDAELAALRFIRQSRQLGFSMKQIAGLLDLWSNPHRASRAVKALAQQHLDELASKMREIAAMKRTLEQWVARCRGDDQPHCAILDGLDGVGRHATATETAPSTVPRRRAGKRVTATTAPTSAVERAVALRSRRPEAKRALAA